ncbi:hypothetical protein JQS43_22715 [Natronosporangium hydrolyticum]|uniref:Uncharacterized protein n=1 Tax=Natronosporangium hydrolyticum TaxID=2811111 RepID=A0A895Y972_9ACTN|nr:hypothetical protein [Natronosporangium hydrolyticum]QSB14287.1 hypothetical protein JQS43_22715 [Natronosporangium hydrolyticum]
MGLIAVAAMLAAGGCSSDSGLPDPPESPPSNPDHSVAEVDLTADEEQAVDEARAVFDQFMTAYNDVLTAGDPATDEVLDGILPLAGGPLAREVNGEIFDNFQAGVRAEGVIEHQFIEIVSLDLDQTTVVGGEDRPVPTVLLHYCMDATEWKSVDKDTGDVVDGPGDRQLTTVTAIYFDSTPVAVAEENLDPNWEVTEMDGTGEPC